MCPACDAFAVKRNLHSFADYKAFVAWLRVQVEAHALVLSGGVEDWPFATLQQTPRPDMVLCVLDCPVCAERFELRADFYHGGGRWGPYVASVIRPWSPSLQ